MSRAERAIERIMSEALKQAASVLDAEVSKFLRANRTRYSRFVLAVGWGPTLFAADGKIVEEWRLKGRSLEMMQFAARFYDAYGADNRQIVA